MEIKIYYFFKIPNQEIEELVEKLQRDSLVVEQVRTLVKQDEELMAAETLIVEQYAQVQYIFTILPFYLSYAKYLPLLAK